MDLVGNINNIVLYWVTKVEPHTKESSFLWGDPISGGYGFGEQAMSYHGNAVFISPSGRRHAQDLSLARGHESRKGFFWLANNESSSFFPEAPFLVTNCLNMKFLRKQEIAFVPSREWAELEEEADRLVEHWVCNAEWIALLQIDTKKSNRKALLWIFSDRPDVSISTNTPLAFCDNPQDSFGMISVISE